MSDKKKRLPKKQRVKLPKVPLWQRILIAFAIIVLMVTLSSNYMEADSIVVVVEEVSLTEFETLLVSGTFDEVQMESGRSVSVVIGIVSITDDETGIETETRYLTASPTQYEDELVTKIIATGVPFEASLPSKSAFEWIALFFPFLLVGGLIFFIIIMMKGGGIGGAGKFTKAGEKRFTKDMPQVRFSDVGGNVEAKEELLEVVEFLKSPDKFRKMGAKIPAGVLLYGPPGTGKTLMARAVAGEAAVPFFSVKGSDFVEMFVGVGASRVRSLFKTAGEEAPSILFIDEIDAVGRSRGTGLGGGNDEREQTLNAILAEMDGMDGDRGIIVIAATNRQDMLDKALVRPGRFDRQIEVDMPNCAARRMILEAHREGKPFAEDVDFDDLAKRTSGFSGADLANLLNESALLAARYDKEQITIDEIEEGRDRVVAGPKNKSKVMTNAERERVAVHEGGHALVGWMLPNADPVKKVTIMPHGQALGYTESTPDEDRNLQMANQLYDQMAVLLGGRAAEEVFYGEVSTGASNDLQRVTGLARQLVISAGMYELDTPIAFDLGGGNVMLGRDMAQGKPFSEKQEAMFEKHIRLLVSRARSEALGIVRKYKDELEKLRDVLLVDETALEPKLKELWGHLGKLEYIDDSSDDSLGERMDS